MNLFQLITIPLVGFLFLRTVLKLLQGQQPRGILLAGAAIWVSAGVAILRPELTMQLAAILGIGRGADLVLYLLVISFLVALFFIYGRFQQLESNITEIIRHLAIRDGLQRWPQRDLETTEEKHPVNGPPSRYYLVQDDR